ncbi:MAG: prolipoprotein diacylglyceryl transferase, partial [Chloroflexi bacterium]
RLNPGDLLFLYGIIYSSGRFWIEGLRIDSLCANGVGGSCEGSIRVAQLVSMVAIVVCGVLIFLNHRRPFAGTPTVRPDGDASPVSEAR